MQIVPGLSSEDLMEVCNEIYESQPRQLEGDFTVREFAEKTDKTFNVALRFLDDLVKKGKLIKIEKAILNSGRRGSCYRANPDVKKEKK